MVLLRTSTLLSLLLFLGSNIKIIAQEMIQGIIVELTNDRKLEYRLTDNPKMVFDGNKVTLTTKDVLVEYTPTELVKVTMGIVRNNESDIEQSTIQNGDIKVNADYLQLIGFDLGESVIVYYANGVICTSFQISDNGSQIIPFSALPYGISIIKVKKQNIKVTRR